MSRAEVPFSSTDASLQKSTAGDADEVAGSELSLFMLTSGWIVAGNQENPSWTSNVWIFLYQSSGCILWWITKNSSGWTNSGCNSVAGFMFWFWTVAKNVLWFLRYWMRIRLRQVCDWMRKERGGNSVCEQQQLVYFCFVFVWAIHCFTVEITNWAPDYFLVFGVVAASSHLFCSLIKWLFAEYLLKPKNAERSNWI